jgi:predicted NAD/FAD-binding protein
VHYLLNRLQPVPFKRPVVLSLNAFERPQADSILEEFDYSHPVFDGPAIAAQLRLDELQGAANTWFCGAWTGYGFHEDGLKSGLAVAAALEQKAERRSVLAA